MRNCATRSAIRRSCDSALWVARPTFCKAQSALQKVTDWHYQLKSRSGTCDIGRWQERPPSFPPQIIAHAVWLYYRFPLSLRLAEEMLLERGNETMRRWGIKFSPHYARRLRRKQHSRNDFWHLDEVVSPSPARNTGCGAPSTWMAMG